MSRVSYFLDSPDNVLINSSLMALTGFFIGGPANLISSAVSADLGELFVFYLIAFFNMHLERWVSLL